MANRLYFAIKNLGFAVMGTSNYQAAHGIQSCSINTNFNLEQVFEFGQLTIYENIENIPNIEVTVEKVLDGYPLLYHLATSGAPSNTIGGRSNQRCMFVMSTFDENKDAASGSALATVLCSGMYVNGITYTLPVQGNCTEQLTLVGNDKRWLTSSLWAGTSNNADVPLAAQGVQRRENVSMSSSRWPTEIPGISAGGVNGWAGSSYSGHIQTVTISANLGRTELFELGLRAPYFRYVNFPLEVTTAIELTAQTTDGINALSDPPGGTNLSNQQIKVYLDDGTILDCGTSNKLQSVTFGGGDTGGGIDSITYNYSNFNYLTVTSPA